MDFSQVRWKRVGLAIGIGILGVMAGTKAYADYQWRQVVCVKFSPEGSEELIYGKDCGEPSQSITSTTDGDEI